MKEETKELIDWIKKHIVPLKETGIVPMGFITHGVEMQDKAVAFLDSLPEIESHLTRGGYIQDKNGTPCCHGNRIIWRGHITGNLIWDIKQSKFIAALDDRVGTRTEFLREDIEKVEK